MKRLLDFLTSVKVELAKIVWPSPSLTIKLTVIVILVTVTVGFFVGGVDYVLTKLLTLTLQR